MEAIDENKLMKRLNKARKELEDRINRIGKLFFNRF
jgi:hypothetical protein